MHPKLQRLLRNYSNARRSWESWCFMVNFDLKAPNAKTAKYIRENELLFHLCYLALKNFYIEIYKILKQSRNTKDNIFLLLEDFASANQSKQSIVVENLQLLENNRVTIDKLCATRDKYYAHLDEDYETYEKRGIPLHDILNCFIAIETAIITLTSLETIQFYLDEIPSKDELKL